MHDLPAYLASALSWSAPLLAARAWRGCWGALLAGVRAMERSIGAPDAETRTTPEEEP